MSQIFTSRLKNMIDRMIQYGWVKSYSLGSGEEITLDWTRKGKGRAVLLNWIGTQYSLASKDEIRSFSQLAHRSVDGGKSFTRENILAVSFWKTCVAELALDPDGEEILLLPDVAFMFGPEDLHSFTSIRTNDFDLTTGEAAFG